MVLDWYARCVVEISLNFHILNNFPIPVADVDHNPVAGRVVAIAARLAAVDDRYDEWAAAVGGRSGPSSMTPRSTTSSASWTPASPSSTTSMTAISPSSTRPSTKVPTIQRGTRLSSATSAVGSDSRDDHTPARRPSWAWAEAGVGYEPSGRTVAEALNGYISHAATDFVGGARLDVASAFFNVGGYALLADSLDRVTGVRLLLGAEPAAPERRPRALGGGVAQCGAGVPPAVAARAGGPRAGFGGGAGSVGVHAGGDADVRRLVSWLRSPDVEVRRLEDRFLHGKAFLVSDRSHGVMAGSSNFTRAGLTSNVELNLGNYSPHVVRQVRDWFEELWVEAAGYDLAGVFAPRLEPHAPYLIFLRMLWEMYGDDLDAEAGGAAQII